MPNTLAHLGLQTAALRLARRGAEVEWIFLGCVLPDLPWILQRGVRVLVPAVDLYDLRLYAIVQTSLAFLLLPCLALALFAARPPQAFALLSASALLHLLLDALQAKYANGVHLLAPFSWELQNWGWVAPEHPLVGIASVAGLVAFAWAWRQPPRWPLRASRSPWRWGCAAAAVTAYAVLPLALLGAPESADNHSVRTLRGPDPRAGKPVAFDRATCREGGAGPILRTAFGEEIPLVLPECPGRTLSLEGRFAADGSVRVEASYAHRSGLRDAASSAGLLLVALVWGRAARKALR